MTCFTQSDRCRRPTLQICQPKPNLNGHSNKDPQRNPVFFNEKSSRILEKKMRSLATVSCLTLPS